MKSVCVVSSTRADYGIMRPLLFRLQADPGIELRLAVTGAQLSPQYGMTVDEIEQDDMPVDCRMPILSDGDTAAATSLTMANALIRFSAYFDKRRPALLLVLGDRYEIAAICCAATNARIPIAHIHGGESTEGAIDEAYRHAITKMSWLHFTSTEAYRKRVIQLGEAPERVFNVGAMGVENALSLPKLTRAELTEQLGFDFHRPYALVCFHPVTLESGTELAQCEALFDALDAYPELGLLITKANADAGGQRINAAIDAYSARRGHCRAVFSLGAQRYLSALQYAEFMIGNSSSGIVEAPALGIPTVNVGDRQKGRIRSGSVLDCAPVKEDIVRAIAGVSSEDFRAAARKAVNPYGDGKTSERIARRIAAALQAPIDLKKTFYDVDFEVSK